MPLRNRVDPFGSFHATPARGDLMGNRGILHDDQKNVVKTHGHNHWVACACAFKDRKRTIMAPRNYTELFFLDEATALAAGHRPCATCRRDRYKAFREAWEATYGDIRNGRSFPDRVDAMLQKARITRGGGKVTYEAECTILPDGAIFAVEKEAFLTWKGQSFKWSFEGYTLQGPVPRGRVEVLTPEPLVAVLSQGYSPELHADSKVE